MGARKQRPEQYILDSKGRTKAVIVPLKRYRQMVEDLHDLTVVAERRKEPTISHEELMGQLKKDGIL